jgi:hypothetical protein
MYNFYRVINNLLELQVIIVEIGVRSCSNENEGL